ncbi:hypothetical protein [Naasia sp. SYSU D00948]|uniref:hypothetical protein n=1 Tax=Naasia sp. SYSU D00948 TaxID=2817379 RepID=UPI001B30D685|nr:hypothetical protein [Naasia sp. SYSU D00948]
MATRARRASRTQVGGWLLAGAGALLLLAFFGPYIGVSIDGWLMNLLFHAALAAGFGFLAANSTGAIRVAFAVAALGWGIRILGIFLTIGGLFGLGDLLAVVGGIVGASLLLSATKTAGRAGAMMLLIATILSLTYVFPTLVAFLGPVLETVPAVFGGALLAAGVLLTRR